MNTDNVSSKLTIKPTIENGRIVHVEVGFEALPLRRPIDLTEFSDFISKLEAISEYIDFEGQAGWTYEDLEFFLFTEITNKAHEFFRILTEEDGWVRRDHILSKMKLKGRSLAGVLSSPGQYFSRWRKEPIYESEKRQEEGDDQEYHYYHIKPKYLNDIREILEIPSN